MTGKRNRPLKQRYRSMTTCRAMCLRPMSTEILDQQVYQPLGNQPLELSTFKELPSGDAHRKAEEGKERSRPALLGAAEEVSPKGEHGCRDTVQCDVTGVLVRAS